MLHRHLPRDYERAVRVLIDSLPAQAPPSEALPAMAPFRYLPHVCFVARFGLEHFEASMQAQYELTQRFSAESSIRPFSIRYPEATYERLLEWATDANVHVRRLVSEAPARVCRGRPACAISSGSPGPCSSCSSG